MRADCFILTGSKSAVGAAHLKNRDTPPPNFGAVAFTFVNAALTLLTHVSIILKGFALTFVNALLTAVNRPKRQQFTCDLMWREQKMTETKRTKNVAFRLTDDEFAQVEKAASAVNDDPNTWCRKMALIQSTEGQTFTKSERLIYQEIALLRFLIGHGFKLLFSRNEVTAGTWKKLTMQADQRSEEIVNEVLSRRL